MHAHLRVRGNPFPALVGAAGAARSASSLPPMFIRRETPADHRSVDDVHTAAFPAPSPGDPPVEVVLHRQLRGHPDFVPALSLVAQDATGGIVGHVVASRARVDGQPVAVGVGPLGVLPRCQRAGVGSALMHALLAAADALGVAVVGLLGDPAFYDRFGFAPAAEAGITAPEESWGEAFQVRVLRTPAPTGRFAYAAPFQQITSPAAAPPMADDAPSVRIREATPEDHDEVARLSFETDDPGTSPAHRNGPDTDTFGRIPATGHLLAEDDAGEIVGYVRLGPPTPLPSNAHVLHVHGLGVAHSHRRRGIARALMQAAIERARAEGCRKISLRVLGGNPGAQALYRSLGFVVEGRLHDEFVIDGVAVDDLLMARYL